MDISKAARYAMVLGVIAGLTAGAAAVVKAADPLPSTSSSTAAPPAPPPPTDTMPVNLNAPSATITNGMVTAKIFLIDPEKGFYRGTRFDGAGMVGSLTYRGQEFYGPWFDRSSPLQVRDFVYTPDGIVAGPTSGASGPVEEFTPLGFDEAAPGGTFLKIGVGSLTRPDDKVYSSFHLYNVADGGTRSVRAAVDNIVFSQSVATTPSGYGYSYQKTLRLVPGHAQMVIEHLLKNTGTREFSTTVFDHNFLRLSPGNGDLAISLPFAVTPMAAPNPDLAHVEGNRIIYTRPLVERERVYFGITGFGISPRDYDITVANLKTGASMRVTGDTPLTQLTLWSIRSVMAMEPFITIKLAPGEERHWAYTYSYDARN